MVTKIENTKDLKAFCKKLLKQPFIAVDTEFMREKTFFSILCLVQIAAPDEELTACIDPLAPDIDLTPLFEVMVSPKVLKVFHSARQDLEIFYELMHGTLPAPLFDTQVGAMVCGLGDSVSYQSIVHHFLHIELDKSSRNTDWSLRPLSERQLTYAIADVTHLVHVYENMQQELEQNGRASWVKDEMNALLNPHLYEIHPEESWKRIKPASNRPKYLGLLQALCAWREERAVQINRPRRHVMRDETVLELAALAPKTPEDLKRLRSMTAALNKPDVAASILEVIAAAGKLSETDLPHLTRPQTLSPTEQNVKEMLRLLLTITSTEARVAAKVIASTDDLEALARSEESDIPAMHGWRYDVFGQKAVSFRNGELALVFNPQKQKIEFKELG